METASVVPEGEYIATVKSAKIEEGNSGSDYIAWELKIKDGKHKDKTLYQNTSLSTNSLWATKRWFECQGMAIPDGDFDFDADECIGNEIGVVVEHDTYKGRTRSKIIDCFPIEDGEKGEEEEEEETKGGDDEELPSDEDIDGMGKAELKELVEKHELEVELEGATSAQRRQVKKAIAAKKTAPAEKSTKSSKTKKKVSADAVNKMDEDELAELVETYDLEADLDKLPNIRRKRAGVIDALEEAELLDDDE